MPVLPTTNTSAPTGKDACSLYYWDTNKQVRTTGFLGPVLQKKSARKVYLKRACHDPVMMSQLAYALGHFGKLGSAAAQSKAVEWSTLYRNEKLRQRDWPKLRKEWNTYSAVKGTLASGTYLTTRAIMTDGHPVLDFFSKPKSGNPDVKFTHGGRAFIMTTDCGGQVVLLLKKAPPSKATPTRTPPGKTPGKPGTHHKVTHRRGKHHKVPSCAIGESWSVTLHKCVKGNTNPYGPPHSPQNPSTQPPQDNNPSQTQPTPGYPGPGSAEGTVGNQGSAPPGGTAPTPSGTPGTIPGQSQEPDGSTSTGGNSGVSNPSPSEGTGQTSSGGPDQIPPP
jgi:hypothetical protein